jgi:CheY-like chemotaxis protein
MIVSVSSDLWRDPQERQDDPVFITPWALVALACVDVGAEAEAAAVLAPRPRTRRREPVVVNLAAARERRRGREAPAPGRVVRPSPAASTNGKAKRIRVVIADDDHLFATGLKALLAHDERLEVVGYAANGRQAVSLAEVLRPDLVLMDLNMPVLGGLEAARQILARGDTRVVVITSEDDTEEAARTHEIGVSTVLPKRVGLHELADRISRLANTIGGRGN